MNDEFTRELLSLRPRLRRFAFSLCHNNADADDLTQSTLLSAWESFDRFEAGTHMSSWLHSILRRKWIDDHRHSRNRLREPLDLDCDDDDNWHRDYASVPPVQEWAVEAREVGDIFAAMDDHYPHARDAILRFAVDDAISVGDLAAEYGCPVGTLKSRMSRTRQALVRLTT